MNDRSRPAKAAPEVIAATETSVTAQPTISGIDAALANSDEWQLDGFLDVCRLSDGDGKHSPSDDGLSCVECERELVPVAAVSAP